VLCPHGGVSQLRKDLKNVSDAQGVADPDRGEHAGHMSFLEPPMVRLPTPAASARERCVCPASKRSRAWCESVRAADPDICFDFDAIRDDFDATRQPRQRTADAISAVPPPSQALMDLLYETASPAASRSSTFPPSGRSIG